MSTPRVYFLANPEKHDASATLEDIVSFASSRCTVAGSSVGLDGRPAIEAKANRIVVLGGDGTLIGAARSLGDSPIPLIGINVGKVGFLAEFSVNEFKSHFARVISDDSLVSRRTMLQATIWHNKTSRTPIPSINDCVIRAGPPFRMVRLTVSINEEPLTELVGDGVIVCTPSGSTAHNLSAGGPIMQAGVDAIILTPLAPHSLTHKPLVIERESVIDIVATEVNPGTTVIIDGQVSCPLETGDRVTVQRFHRDFLLVRNPALGAWHHLITKLHWGRSPQFD